MWGRNLRVLLTGVIGVISTTSVSARLVYPEDEVRIHFGVYEHFQSSQNYEGPPVAMGLEVKQPNQWLYGFTLFNNSFGQFSQYVYGGRVWSWRFGEDNKLLFKLTGGVIHGYTGKARHKLKYNCAEGIAPGVVPSIGIQRKRWGADLVLLGDAGLMITLNFPLRS